MFGTIRKHQNWLWVVIITVIIISFVVFFTPEVRLGGNPAAQANFGSIGGRPITQQEYRDAFDEARIGYFMRSNGREWPGGDENTQRAVERDAVFRVFLKEKIKEMNIRASDEAVGHIVRERLGTYPLANFEREHLAQQGLSLQDFERFLRHEAALQQLVNTAGVSARLLNPREAEILYQKENQQAFVEVALFSGSNRLDQVTVAQPELMTFYTNRMSLYRIPDRIRVSYVAFAATNFFEEADKRIGTITNLEAQIDEYYFQKGTNTFKDTNGVVLSAADAKKQIKEEIRHGHALLEARRKANEFGAALMDQPQGEKLETFEKFAAARGLPVLVTEPFDRVGGLENTNFPPEFRQRALALTPDIPVLFNPIVGPGAVFLIALKEKIPSQMPPFEQVKDKVTADFKLQQAVEIARQSATNFYALVTNALKTASDAAPSTTTFAGIAARENVTLITPPPFSPGMTTLTNLDERLNLRMLQQFAFEMKPGDLTSIIPNAGGALIIHLKHLKPVDDAIMKAELPEFLGRLRLYRQNEVFNQWFRKQLEQARVLLPQRELPTPSPAPGQPPPPPPPTRS